MSPRNYSLEHPPARLGADCRSCEHLKDFAKHADKYKKDGVTEEWLVTYALRSCSGTPSIEDIDPTLEYWQKDDARLCTIGLLKSQLDAEINMQKYCGKTE